MISRTYIRLGVIGIIVSAIAFLAMALFVVRSSAPPRNVPEDIFIDIAQGQGVRATARTLKEQNIIRSEKIFLIRVHLGEKIIQAGRYRFDEPLSVAQVIERLHLGDLGDVYTRIRMPEGGTRKDFAERVSTLLPEFDAQEFMRETATEEGFLFPDTYFFLPDATARDVAQALRRRFEEKIAPLQTDIQASRRTLSDIIIMASIIEKEATNDYTEQRTIAGILWKRLDTGMLLQVDAPFMYTIGKGSAQLTRADLASDSPYNTYRLRGLPPTAIGSPSLSAIRAALYPLDSPYFFYLHGNDGIVRYGRNFEEHIRNRQRHLRLR
ncbi:MAG: endolytic transglycosylase MltG [Candidatus Pacebacteria bacterium]|nr:endolytic transglycosylase MltG [Candidatus Paceibacterota bacterium]MCD8507865.1 endolytic transglycosylase MltG [Candidatus Paceibacterota bacterium]MCD8527939.1 endolytic transglycosylase MltG [Candidatus Paceibacterota bacterium]MCD8563946.1 endolytic transglycosylase MltG [Candidatus Paceibacterota bacterium]